MKTTAFPSLEEFLSAPAEQVAAVAPTTMFLAPGGTRREAILAGISPQSEDYPRWSRNQMMDCADLLFQLGVRHIFLTALRSAPLAEVGRFRDRLIDWTDQSMAGSEMLAEYARRGWRVRLIGAEAVPELHAAQERLYAATPEHWEHTVWMYVSSAPDSHWSSILAIAHQYQARTRAEVIRALCGEDVPPATLSLSWGKPMIGADIMPLLLADEVQCYWTQRPGFAQGERTIRQIFYDYAYTRHTWRQDKSTRYTGVLEQRELWERPMVLGIGQRIGAFWYPTHEEYLVESSSQG